MIRKATPSDCLNLAALSMQVWLNTYANQGLRNKISQYVFSTFNEQYFQVLIAKPNIEVWVYIIDDHLVAFIAVDLEAQFKTDENGYEIATLYVAVQFQGQGIGRQLLRHVNAEHGATYWLSTWVENHNATKFYQSLGFKIIGELNFDLEGELHSNHVLGYSEIQ